MTKRSLTIAGVSNLTENRTAKRFDNTCLNDILIYPMSVNNASVRMLLTTELYLLTFQSV